MSAQTLNIIYDTNYTNVVSDGGFVDHQFAQKVWFWDLLFWSPKDLEQKAKSAQNNTTKEEPKQQEGQPQVQSQEQASQAQPQGQSQWQTSQEQKTDNANQKQKSPWFFDLLFGPLNAPQPAKAEEPKKSEEKNNEW